ncbi:NAD-binding protein [Pseudogracilibacillus sp. ICA-222130]|uniref:NAD-binding protein n=1 Tax=Pseudogracilibacillus sp. ICA-222130 TaxID=3134655 RepID=UPI0030BF2008
MEEKRSTWKQVTLYYYITIIVATALILGLAPIDDSIDGPIIIILAIYLLGFPVVLRYTYRYALHIFLFMLAFITGLYGFYHLSVDHHSLSNALYFTFRLYLLDFADVFTVDGTSPTQYPLLLEIARWSAASYTISTVFIAMYRTLEMRFLLFRVQRFGKHYVIFGYHEKSHLLIEDLRHHRETVVVIDEDFSIDAIQRLEEMGVIVLPTAIHDQTIFSKSAVHKAKSVLLFEEKDQDSLYTLMELENFVERHKKPMPLQKLIIHLENVRYQKELTSFIENMEGFSFHVEIINVYHMLSVKFWQEHEHIFTKSKRLDVLVVGNGKIGTQMVAEAEKMYEKQHVSIPFSLTVLGDFPRKTSTGNQIHLPFHAETDELVTVIENEEKDFTHIFICLEEDYVDLMEGIDLSEIFPETPIFMNFSDKMIDHTFKIVTTESEKTLYSMGTLKDVLTKEMLQL